MRLFRNRSEAAEELARHLAYLKPEKPVVLGLHGGGVQVAEIIAKHLEAPLDVVLIEKLFAPGGGKDVVGAVDEHGRISMIQATARWHHVTSQQMVAPAREAFRKLQIEQGRIRSHLPELDVRGRTVVIVNDGVGSGARFLGAVASVRDRGARKVVVAAPAGRTEATWQLHESADIVVIPHRPTQYKGIDHFYEEYTSLSDDAVLGIVRRWTSSRPDEHAGVRTIVLKVAGSLNQQLACELDVPGDMQRGGGPYPAAIFIHALDSDARSSRNIPISRRLAKRGIIGVRMSLTGHGASEGTMEQATDVQSLQDLHAVFQAVQRLHEVDPNRIGIVGSGEGALIALHYAARFPNAIKALVIRGPVLGNESEAAHQVTAPTLLIHAEHDTALVECVNLLDRELLVTHEVLRIPDSNRMFSDPISRELMVNASVQWMADHLAAIPPSEDRAPAREVAQASGA